MAALILEARDRIFPTDVACWWSQRKAPEDAVVDTVDSIYKGRKFTPNYEPVDAAALRQLYEDLRRCPGDSGAGARFLLQPASAPAPDLTLKRTNIPDALEVICDPEFTEDNPRWFVEERLVLSRAEVVEVAAITTSKRTTRSGQEFEEAG